MKYGQLVYCKARVKYCVACCRKKQKFNYFVSGLQAMTIEQLTEDIEKTKEKMAVLQHRLDWAEQILEMKKSGSTSS